MQNSSFWIHSSSSWIVRINWRHGVITMMSSQWCHHNVILITMWSLWLPHLHGAGQHHPLPKSIILNAKSIIWNTESSTENSPLRTDASQSFPAGDHRSMFLYHDVVTMWSLRYVAASSCDDVPTRHCTPRNETLRFKRWTLHRKWWARQSNLSEALRGSRQGVQ